MAGYILISPGGNTTNPADMLAKMVCWLGNDPANTGLTGAYFKTSLWVGGNSPATAPFKVDSAGNVSIDGNVLVAGTVTLSALTGWSGASINVGGGGLSFTGTGGILLLNGGSILCTPGGVTGNYFKCSSMGSGYWYGAEQGLTTTRIVKDGNGVSKTVYIRGGIITGWDL